MLCWLAYLALGAFSGILAGLLGVGGGLVIVQNAIGTSAAIGFPIALAGAAGYMVNGLKLKAILPPETLGFVHLPALAGVSVASMLTAPIGAHLAHRLPALLLKQIFAMLLVGIGTKMLSDLF